MMARASNHRAASRRNTHALTTPRATCTPAGGLDAETFCGLQLAGELFLLTSFFIEPEVYDAGVQRIAGAVLQLHRQSLCLEAGEAGEGRWSQPKGTQRSYANNLARQPITNPKL